MILKPEKLLEVCVPKIIVNTTMWYDLKNEA